MFEILINNLNNVEAIILLFTLITSTAVIFIYKKDQSKILATMFIVGLTIRSNNKWVYLLGLVVIGTLITGPETMIELIRAIKTKINENKNIDSSTLTISNKVLEDINHK